MDAPQTESLHGRRVLVVEDEDLVATLLEGLLSRLGCEAVTATRLSEAIALATRDSVDVALLDVMMAGKDVHPVVEILAQRRIPYAFVTGYGLTHTTGIYRDRPVLSKPITLPGLKRVLQQALGPRN